MEFLIHCFLVVTGSVACKLKNLRVGGKVYIRGRRRGKLLVIERKNLLKREKNAGRASLLTPIARSHHLLLVIADNLKQEMM
jgi:hypothetical protein